MTVRDKILGRVLALGILAAVPLCFWLAVIDPIWQSWADGDEAEARTLQMIAAFRQTAALRPALDSRLKEIEAHSRGSSGLVAGNTPALAAAGVQAEIKRIIESRGGQVRSTQDLVPVREGAVEKIGVRFDITTSLEALPSIVYEIEAHVPYLFIDNLEIRAPEDSRSQTLVANKPILIIRWDVFGYRSAGAT